jgi:hypothetical protein
VTAVGAPRAGRREWIGLAVIVLPCLLYSMDLTVLELAVPKLSATLQQGGRTFASDPYRRPRSLAAADRPAPDPS